MHKSVAALCLITAAASLRGSNRPVGWTGNYAPCDQHRDTMSRGPMSLGVRFSTSNHGLAVQFAHALDFWATILDMQWHEENSRNCAIQIVDGYPGLFEPMQIARAQIPGQITFQGWIAFNPKVSLPSSEQFSTAVHELGHVLGLRHSRNSSSVMYFLHLDGPVFLDRHDLAALAARHKLRDGSAGADAINASYSRYGDRELQTLTPKK